MGRVTKSHSFLELSESQHQKSYIPGSSPVLGKTSQLVTLVRDTQRDQVRTVQGRFAFLLKGLSWV